MRLQELTTSLTRSQLGVWAGDTMVRFRGSSSSCFTACRTGLQVHRSASCGRGTCTGGGRMWTVGCAYLQQRPVLADEPLRVVWARLGCWFGKSWQRLGKLCLLLQQNVLLLLLPFPSHFQHAGRRTVKQRARRDDRLPVALLLLPACNWTESLSQRGSHREDCLRERGNGNKKDHWGGPARRSLGGDKSTLLLLHQADCKHKAASLPTSTKQPDTQAWPRGAHLRGPCGAACAPSSRTREAAWTLGWAWFRT